MINHIFLAMSTLPKKNKLHRVSKYVIETREWIPCKEVNLLSNDITNIETTVFSYQTEENNTYKITDCKSQLEPVPKLMMQVYPEKTNEFVIYELCSAETLDEYEIEGGVYSATSFFEERITKCDDLQGRKIRFERILLEDLRNPYDAIKEAIEKVRQNYKEDSKHRLWIDTHGGIRDIAQTFSAIVSLLKVEDIVPEEIFGIEMGNNFIVSQKGAFSIFEYVSGMNDFINFGNADVLNHYYEKHYSGKNNANIRPILDAMKKIAAGTQLCDPDEYTEGIKMLRSSIQRIEDDPLLSIFSEYIKKDYGEELIPSDANDSNREVPPLAIVERCVKKGLYQQALTFLESMMPEEFVKKYCIYVEENSLNQVKDAKKKGKKNYLSDEHYLFDEYLFNHVFYAEKNIIPVTYPRERWAIWAIEQLNKFYLEQNGEYFEQYPDGFKRYLCIYNAIYKRDYNTGEKRTVIGNIKTNLSREDIPVFVFLLQIHKALKDCRNLFNHCNGRRPDITEIENVLHLYIIYAKYILKKY